MRILGEAINARRCAVTEECFEEIKFAEKSGKLQEGVTQFVDECMLRYDNHLELPPISSMLNAEDIKENRTYKDKHYKLTWDAACLADERCAEVYIITLSQKFTNLAKAQGVEVCSLWKMEKTIEENAI